MYDDPKMLEEVYLVLTVCTQPSFSFDLLLGSDAGGFDPYLRRLYGYEYVYGGTPVR